MIAFASCGFSAVEPRVDVAIGLMPPTGKHNWAIAAYVEFFEDWKSDLRKAVHWDVSLTAIGPGLDMDAEVRDTGMLLWRRD